MLAKTHPLLLRNICICCRCRYIDVLTKDQFLALEFSHVLFRNFLFLFLSFNIIMIIIISLSCVCVCVCACSHGWSRGRYGFSLFGKIQTDGCADKFEIQAPSSLQSHQGQAHRLAWPGGLEAPRYTTIVLIFYLHGHPHRCAFCFPLWPGQYGYSPTLSFSPCKDYTNHDDDFFLRRAIYYTPGLSSVFYSWKHAVLVVAPSLFIYAK